MKAGTAQSTITEKGIIADNLVRRILGLMWQVVRLPILAILVILEPVVRLVLWSAASLGVLTSFLFEFSGAAPEFPFWSMIAISIGCMLLLAGYYYLIGLFRDLF